MNSLRYFILLTACSATWLLVSASGAQAQTINDSGTWLAVFARGDLNFERFDSCDCSAECGESCCDCCDSCEPCSGRVKWWFDGHARFFDNAGGFGQSIVRPGIGYALTDSLTLWAGYGWIRTSPGGSPDFDEDRVWQQLTWSRKYQPFTLGLRSRLEQRFLETGSDTGWRFRQLVSARRSLEAAPNLSLVVWDEVFINFNSTNWGANGGFDQNRIFLGMGFKPACCCGGRVEVGYLNQYVGRPGSDDLSNHLVSINFYPSF